MDRIVVALFLSVLVFDAKATDLFGTLGDFSQYESELPCESESKSCPSTNGLMGKALDTASEAGLAISKIIESPKDAKVFVETKTYGTCMVATNSDGQLGPMGFICSSKGHNKKGLLKIDRVLSLQKQGERFLIADFTDKAKLKGSL